MDENTRPWYTINELNAWADKCQNEQWHKAAIRLGEELASVGPVGYYEMDASEWLDWALNQLKEKNMKSEQIKHSLSVGVKSIQSRVFDSETDEVISFVKIPIMDSGLVRCEWIELTDEEILEIASPMFEDTRYPSTALDFARAILRKAQRDKND